MTRSVSLPASCSPFFARFDSCANLRLLYGARHPDAPAPLRSRTFQSTRPVWGATRRRGRKTIFAQFQSTRPRGARRRIGCRARSPPSFNPRARVGRDSVCSAVSAPVASFNPRARVGRDQGRDAVHARRRSFQSTRPRGARLQEFDFSFSTTYFNPRARVGRDAAKHPLHAQILISIHAPAWGATFVSVRIGRLSPHFNPRARVGRDVPRVISIPPSPLFQSTRPRGARLRRRSDGGRPKTFQSTRPRGARPSTRCGAGCLMWFQSTRPRGARQQT